MKCFTIESGRVKEGITVTTKKLVTAEINIPIVSVGEAGRGRKFSYLPVELNSGSKIEWAQHGDTEVYSVIQTNTRRGTPKLKEVAGRNTEPDFYALCVFQTKIGYRGSNEHTGDLDYTWFSPHDLVPPRIRKLQEQLHDNIGGWKQIKQADVDAFNKQHLELIQNEPNIWVENKEFYAFPGEILTEGWLAQGIAGNMGSGTQLIAILPEDVVFRTAYSGRLYGSEPEHYYIYTEGKIIALSWDERVASDLF